jgi:hypothetical protein
MPDQVEQYVKSATHRRLGALAVKLRFTRSSGRWFSEPGVVVRVLCPPRTAPVSPSSFMRRATLSRPASSPSRCSCHHTFSAP